MAAPPIPKLTTSQWALVKKAAAYYLKHKLMINEYKKSKDRAISKYEAAGFIVDRVKNYRARWESTMQGNYETKISDIDARLRAWVIGYCSKMFGITLTATEADSVVAALKIGITPLSP